MVLLGMRCPRQNRTDDGDVKKDLDVHGCPSSAICATLAPSATSRSPTSTPSDLAGILDHGIRVVFNQIQFPLIDRRRRTRYSRRRERRT